MTNTQLVKDLFEISEILMEKDPELDPDLSWKLAIKIQRTRFFCEANMITQSQNHPVALEAMAMNIQSHKKAIENSTDILSDNFKDISNQLKSISTTIEGR